ncbi:MAG TPA: hypothetical protein VGM04_07505 [Sphingomicrobium sp.]|jgi:hypothetical protein
MSFLRLIGIQGIAGIAVSLALGILLLIQKGETRHWKKESARFERLYGEEQAALAGTIANYRAAANAARAADQANLERVAAKQRSINERTSDDYETRLAAARTLAQRLRGQAATAATDSRAGGATPVSGLSAPAPGPAETAGKDGLPDPDRLLATEQAIQLDELIKWVQKQSAIDPNAIRK